MTLSNYVTKLQQQGKSPRHVRRAMERKAAELGLVELELTGKM